MTSNPKYNQMQLLNTIATILLLLTRCSLGPSMVGANRLNYNDAVQLTERQELLLNIVRLRYNEGPEFLRTSSISSQFRIEMSGSANASIGKDQEQKTDLFGIGGSVGYSELPTITFTPQNEKEFTQQLISPIEIEAIILLINYGWDIDRVLRLTSDGINGLRKDTIREAPRKDHELHLREFAHAVGGLGRLQELGLMEVSFEPEETIVSGPISAEKVSLKDILQANKEEYKLEYYGKKREYFIKKVDRYPVLRFSRYATIHPELQQAIEWFNLDSKLQSYRVLNAPGAQIKVSDLEKPLGLFILSTTTVLGTMAYLAQGVTVPDQHKDRGLVPGHLKENSGTGLLSGLFEVRAQREKPNHASLAVPFKDQWFYIDDADISSNRTMGVVNSLMRLKVKADGTQNVPILTLPVGR